MSSNFVLDLLAGESEWTHRIRRRVFQLAKYSYNVLISGPNGAGKATISRAIHSHSPRHKLPFIPVSCDTLTGRLMRAQLFGNDGTGFGLFGRPSLGCLRSADGGTILFEDVFRLDIETQTQLSEMLREKRVIPVGNRRESFPIDVRVFATSSLDLQDEVRAGRFRLDLFYQLSATRIETIGLKDRVDDIEPLVRHFLAKQTFEKGLPMKCLTPAALALLETHDWSGNVEELELAIECAIDAAQGDVLEADLFSTEETEALEFQMDSFKSGSRGLANVSSLEKVEEYKATAGRWRTIADLEKVHIEQTLREVGFRRSAAARLLDISRDELDRKIIQYGIAVPSMMSRRNGFGTKS